MVAEPKVVKVEVVKEVDAEKDELLGVEVDVDVDAEVDREVGALAVDVEAMVLTKLGFEVDVEVVVAVAATEVLTASVMLGYPEYMRRAALSVKLGIRLPMVSFK